MAYFVRRSAGVGSSGTTLTVDVPSSLQNDLIIFAAVTNGGSAVSTIVGNNGGTWTQRANQFGDDEIWVWSCTQGATPDTSVTVTWTATEIATWDIAVIRGADTTTPMDATATSQNSNSKSPVAPSITTANANSLIYYAASTGNGNNMYAPEGIYLLGNQEDGTRTNIMTAYTYQAAAGATGTRTFYSARDTAANASMVTLAIRDDGSGNIKGYHDPAVKAFEYLHLMSEDGGIFSDGTTYDPTNVANENISSMTNGSYTNSSTAQHNSAPTPNGILEAGYTSQSVQTTSGTQLNQALLTGFPITETDGIQDNYNLSGELIIFSAKSENAGLTGEAKIGAALGLSDKTNVRFWQLSTPDSVPAINSGLYPTIIDVDDSSFVMSEVGTPNTADIGYIILCTEPTLTNNRVSFTPISIMRTLDLQGGSSGFPCSFETAYDIAKQGLLNTIIAQGGIADSQFFIAHNTQCGGTAAVYWDSSNQSAEWPGAYSAANSKRSFKIAAGKLTHTIAPITGSTVIYDSCTLNFGNYHNFVVNSSAVSISSDGLVVLNADVTLTAHSGAMSGISFIGCKEITNSVDLSGGNTIQGCVDTYAITVTSKTEFENLQNCDFKDNNYSIRITGNHSGTSPWSAAGMTVSGGTGSYDIRYEGTGTLEINVDTGSGFSQSRAEATVGTLTLTAPTVTLTVNSNIASSDIKIFTTNTQTIVASATGTTANTTTAGTYDITVQKAGYLPQRQTGVVLGASSVTVDVTLVKDPIYSASSLLFGTDYSYDASTRVMTIVSNQEGRDLYSALIEDFISETALRNCPFPLTAVGPDRIDFNAVGYYNTATTVGATIDAGDIQFWKGAGMVWEHDTSGNPTKKFYSIKSASTLQAGTVVGYTQVNNGTPAESTLVSNQVNQVIQYFEDTNGDGSADYDYTGHLLFKAFKTGYYQARWDVINDSGVTSMEPYEYTINLVQEAIAGTTGDQAITIATLTDHTGAPLSVGGKSFDYELVDPGTNTAEALLAQVNYDVFTAVDTLISGTIYTSYKAFDLPDLIVEAGSSYETERGYFEGDGAVTDLSGVYLSRSSADHPDISRFQSNDGTYYTPTVTANGTGTNLPDDVGGNTRLQIANLTALSASAWQATTAYTAGDIVLRSTGLGTENTAGLFFRCTTGGTSGGTEPTWVTTTAGVFGTSGSETTDGTVTWECFAILLYDADPASTGWSDTYIDGYEFKSGETARIRFAHMNAGASFEYGQATAAVTTSGFSFDGSLFVAADTIYATNAIDGSSLTGTFSPDYSNNEMDLDTNTDFQGIGLYAYYCYELTTTNGMHTVWGAWTALDVANYRNNTSVFSMYLDETAGFVKQTDSVRIFRDDDARPARDPTTGGNGIELNWRNPVYGYDAGGGGFTASDRSDLQAAKAKTDQLTFSKANELDSNIKSVADTTVTGSGTALDPWGP